MQRSSSIALGALVVAVVALLLVRGGRRPPPPERPSWVAALSASVAMPMPTLSVPALIMPSALVAPVASGPVRRLPANAPKNLHFGVILVQYRGAQFAPEQAPYKPDALQRARQLAEAARRDFKAAVAQGDPGSTEDAGRVARNILEPAVEVELFSLAPGSVSDPVDTPRGYLIARRLD